MAPAPMAPLYVLLLLALLAAPSNSEGDSQECLCCEPYSDVRFHLSTSTRYHDALEASGGPQEMQELPLAGASGNGTCHPFFMFFVSRHGTREPTQKRVRQINRFSARLHQLAAAAHSRHSAGSKIDSCAENALRWMSEFRSPWEGYHSGGQLTEQGEKELFGIGQRLRERFPALFRRPYHSQAHPIFSTQVARSAASAVAFGLGMFEGQGALGASRSRAFAVVSETATTDTKLRFHDLCPGYTTAVDESQPHLDYLWGRVYAAVAADLAQWTGAPFEAADVDSLWLVCRQQDAVAPEGFTVDSDRSDAPDADHEEAPGRVPEDVSKEKGGRDSEPHAGGSVEGSEVEGSGGEGTEGAGGRCRRPSPFSACDVFAPEHVAALEWVDDANTFMQKGYGREVNFRMAVPLFQSMASALEAAVAARTKPSVAPPPSSHSSGDSDKPRTGLGGAGAGQQGEGRGGEAETQGEGAGEGEVGGTEGGSRRDKKGKKKKTKKGGVRELAQLHFAHAETVIPLACLLGLFQEPPPSTHPANSTDSSDSSTQYSSRNSQSQVMGASGGEPSRNSEGEDEACGADGADVAGQRCARSHAVADAARIFSALEGVRDSLASYHGSSVGLPLPLVPVPPPPPSSRTWMGRDVAPYAANLGVTLVDCGEGDPERFRVLVLHNERAVVLPDCGEVLCPFSKFKSNVVEGHLQHSFDSMCRVMPQPTQDGILARFRDWFRRGFLLLQRLTSSTMKTAEL